MFAAQNGIFRIGSHRRPDAMETVCRNRHTDPGTAEQHAAIGFARHDRPAHSRAEDGIIISTVQTCCTAIHHRAAGSTQIRRQFFLEFESAVIGAQCNSGIRPDKIPDLVHFVSPNN